MNAPFNTQQLSSFLESRTNGRPIPTSNAAVPMPSSSSSAQLNTLTSAETTDTSTSNANPAPTQTADHENRTRVGAITGGAVGGAVFLAAAIFLCLFLLRRRKRIKEDIQATLPPPYPRGDMSEQLASTTTTAHSESKITGDYERAPNLVPQLDSTEILPTNEANVDALGNIPELPATERNSDLATMLPSSATEPWGDLQNKPEEDRPPRRSADHVMS